MADAEITWTEEEFREFKGLVDDINAPGFNNPRRPIGRTNMRAFVDKHGKAKCDAMFAKLEGK